MRILDAIGLDVPVHDGINGEPGYRFYSQFLGYVLSVTDDCGEADVQLIGYFLVDKSLGDELQHLDFASGKVVRIDGLGMRMLASLMPVLVQLEDGLDELLLALIDVQGKHPRELGKVLASGKDNGTRPPFAEEGRMLEVDLCRHEVVCIHVGCIIHQFPEGVEHTDGGHWNDFFQERFKPHTRKGVGVDDGYFGIFIVHHRLHRLAQIKFIIIILMIPTDYTYK